MKFSDLKMPKSKKTPQLLLERPPPPSVEELVDDIKHASNDDIAFRREKTDSNLGLSHADISQFTTASLDDDQDDLLTQLAEDDEVPSEVNETYDKVVELITLADRLHRAPEELRTLQKAMNDAAAKLDESVKSLTARASKTS